MCITEGDTRKSGPRNIWNRKECVQKCNYTCDGRQPIHHPFIWKKQGRKKVIMGHKLEDGCLLHRFLMSCELLFSTSFSSNSHKELRL